MPSSLPEKIEERLVGYNAGLVSGLTVGYLFGEISLLQAGIYSFTIIAFSEGWIKYAKKKAEEKT